MENTQKKMDENRAEQEKRLNTMALEWKAIPNEGNEAQRIAYENKIAAYALKLYDRYYKHFYITNKNGTIRYTEEERYDAFISALLDVLKHFDSEKGTFIKRLMKVFPKRLVDISKKNNEYQFNIVSADQQISDENDMTVWEKLEDEEAENCFSTELTDSVMELVAAIMKFAKEQDGTDANKLRRLLWYSLFYTEDITQLAQSMEVRFRNEKEIFEAVKEAYLDYYMSRICRTMAEIAVTPLKYYEEIMEDSRYIGKEIPVPLPAKISLLYLKNCEGIDVLSSARSNQQKMYQQMKENIRK